MKAHHILKASLALLFFCVIGKSFSQVQTFEWQSVQRQYMVRQPSTTFDDTPPVLFFLHGLGDNITRVDQEFNFTALAERFGWEMVIPQARNQNGSSMWNAAMMSSNIDDVGFLMALLDTLTAQHHLDPDSVFFTGFSMGGFMSHRMAIEKGDRITACAPVSGLITFTMSSVTPVAPVRMLHIHGTSDPVVGYNGNSQYFGGTLGIGVDAIMNYWKAANDCAGEPVIDTFPNTHNDGLRFVRYTYDCGTDLQLLKVIGGNHTWYHNANQTDIAYMDEIHAFFTGTQETDLTGFNETLIEGFRVWPNPAFGRLEVETAVSTTFTMMDLQGKVMFRRSVEAGVSYIDLGDCPAGLYLLKQEDGTVTKVVVR